MKYRGPLIGLTLFMVVALTLTWLVYASLRRDVAGKTASYSAVFTDVYGLREGDDVRMAGVRVGRVEKIDLEGKLAKVSFVVQQEQHLFGNTVASVTYQNIVGQRYLGLSLGKGRQPGAAVARAASSRRNARNRPSTSPRCSTAIEPLFSLLNPHDADNLTKGVIAVTAGRHLVTCHPDQPDIHAHRDIRRTGSGPRRCDHESQQGGRQPCCAERQSRRCHHADP